MLTEALQGVQLSCCHTYSFVVIQGKDEQAEKNKIKYPEGKHKHTVVLLA